MTKCIEVTTTEYAECYAMVEKGMFKIGHISDLSHMKGGKRKYCKPFVEFECNEDEDPARLFQIWAKRLEKPVEPIPEGYLALPGDCIRFVPTCPTCKEVTYGHSRCPFCGQLFGDENKAE